MDPKTPKKNPPAVINAYKGTSGRKEGKFERRILSLPLNPGPTQTDFSLHM